MSRKRSRREQIGELRVQGWRRWETEMERINQDKESRKKPGGLLSCNPNKTHTRMEGQSPA